MACGLKDRYRAALISILSADRKVDRVVLFGSRARGSHRPASDVDLVLFGPELGLRDQGRLSVAIEETSVPQRVDLLLHHHIENERLLDQIDRDGVEWFDRYANENAASHCAA